MSTTEVDVVILGVTDGRTRHPNLNLRNCEVKTHHHLPNAIRKQWDSYNRPYFAVSSLVGSKSWDNCSMFLRLPLKSVASPFAVARIYKWFNPTVKETEQAILVDITNTSVWGIWKAVCFRTIHRFSCKTIQSKRNRPSYLGLGQGLLMSWFATSSPSHPPIGKS